MTRNRINNEPASDDQFQMYIAEVAVIDHPDAPVNGHAVYIVVNETSKHVTLCYPWTLSVFDIPLQSFIRNVGLTYWPPEKRDAPVHDKSFLTIDRTLAAMEEKMADYTKWQKRYSANSIRRIIAQLRGIPLDQVPLYKETKTQTDGAVRERQARKPGVIDAIKELLEDGYTVDEFVGKLAERFPDREPDGMRNTVKCQLARLPRNTNRPIMKTDMGNGRLVFKWGK